MPAASRRRLATLTVLLLAVAAGPVTRSPGSIEEGKQADLVLLDANPLDDITRISQISGVVLRGRYFDRTGLARILDEVAASQDVAVNDWTRTPKR